MMHQSVFSLILISLFPLFAHAGSMTTFLSVPFQNIILNPNKTIQAGYSFGNNPIIFCYENNLQSVGIVTWPYRGNIFSSTLSVSLITNNIYQGQFADGSGTITVTNNTANPLVVNCVFAF